MTVTATLIGSQSPPLVQVVVSETPDGEPWVVTGSAAGASWVVPGGRGVGDGEQLNLADNRGPLNVPITYTFASSSVTESSAPVTVPQASGDAVLQTLTGQRSVVVELWRPSLDTELELFQAVFPVPGRRTPPVRYTATGAGGGQFVVKVPKASAAQFDAVMEAGGPILYRTTAEPFDLPRVGVILPRGLTSTALDIAGFRIWTMPWIYTADPFMDARLGAFDWDFFDSVFSTLDWDDFDGALATLTWDQFDTLDWSTL